MPTLPNARHERMSQELAAGEPAAKAYVLAGFKENRHNAATLARKQHILERVAEILKEREEIHGQATAAAIEKTGLTKEWIIGRLIENANRAMQAEPARDDEGNPIGDYHYQGTVANRALELLGKEIGMFIDRKEVGAPGEFERLSDSELEAFVFEAAREIRKDLH